MAVELWGIVGGGAAELLKRDRTNAHGRLDEPLLAGEMCRIGRYELRFDTGAYWQVSGLALPDPPFLDVIPIRFAIADADAHYHVPLLCSPWAYSTYRGS